MRLEADERFGEPEGKQAARDGDPDREHQCQ